MNKKAIKMKTLFFTSIILLFSLTANAQKKVKEDMAIEKTIINYIENYFENNFDEMNKSLHSRLAKRGLNPNGTLSDDFPPEKLKELMSTKQKIEVQHQYNVVENITIYGNMASATLRTGFPKTRWSEYIHLVKQEGYWKIINVFWEFEKKEPTDNGLKELISNTHLYFSETPIINEDIHSFLISKDGEIINQYYYNGFTEDSLNNTKSITKSIIGLLIGIAIDQQLIKDVNQPVINYFEDCEDHSGFSDKNEITIENLLMMQSGIQWNNRATIKDEWWFHDKPNCFFLNHFPMDTSTTPGVKFSYNSAAAHLLSGIISRVSGMTTKQFADKYLFAPLNIKDYKWEQDRAGEYRGNSELYLLPKDMLKIGNLLLKNGTYQGKSIISNSWIKCTLESAYDATPSMNYGYLWMSSKDKYPFFFFAGGTGGHHIFIIPKYDLVIVTTGHWDNARSTREIMTACVELIKKQLDQ